MRVVMRSLDVWRSVHDVWLQWSLVQFSSLQHKGKYEKVQKLAVARHYLRAGDVAQRMTLTGATDSGRDRCLASG